MIRPVFAQAITAGVDLHRIQTPAQCIPGAIILPLGFQEIPNHATHIIFNSLFTYTAGQQSKMFAACRAQGLKVILDIDDHWQIPETHSKYPQLKASNYAAEVVQCIKAADQVWCASKLLLDECKKLNRESYYVPNTYYNHHRAACGRGKRFGYVAHAQDHLRDASLLCKAFEKLAQENNELQVGWCGYQPTDAGNAMRAIFEKAGAHFIGQYRQGPTYWWHFMSFDVAIAPLEKTTFNSYKSNLKAVEAGAMGCAFICSDAPPYEDLDHGTNCLKARTRMDWYRQIKKLHTEPNLAEDLSYNLQQYVQEIHNPIYWANQRVELLQKA